MPNRARESCWIQARREVSRVFSSHLPSDQTRRTRHRGARRKAANRTPRAVLESESETESWWAIKISSDGTLNGGDSFAWTCDAVRRRSNRECKHRKVAVCERSKLDFQIEWLNNTMIKRWTIRWTIRQLPNAPPIGWWIFIGTDFVIAAKWVANERLPSSARRFGELRISETIQPKSNRSDRHSDR